MCLAETFGKRHGHMGMIPGGNRIREYAVGL
jgi:hypothetical protein